MNTKDLPWRAALMAVAIAAAGVSCSGETTAPGATAAVIRDAGGNSQLGIMGAPLDNPIVVKVTDLDGDVVGGAVVTFEVTSGGGTLARTSVATDAQGMARTEWTLGSGASASSQTARATLGSGAGLGVAFTATAHPIVELLSGDAQTGEVVQPLAARPTIAVRDAAGNPIAGMPVAWRVTTGGGTVAGSSAVTNAAGESSMAWTLGPKVGDGVHVLEATAGGSVPTRFVASGVLTAGTLRVVSGDGQSGFTGQRLDNALIVAVETPAPGSRRVAGVAVDWAVTGGGGTVSNSRVVTNGSGEAFVFWAVGTVPGTNNQGATASVAGLGGSPVVFVASAGLTPGSITMVSGNDQAGVLGTTLPAPLVVLVQDEAGQPLPGATVTWDISHDWGYGPYSHTTSTTDALGHASLMVQLSGEWAGTGTVDVGARAKGLDTQAVWFNASTFAGPPATIRFVDGNFQSAPAGTLLPLPITVELRDQHGNPTPGVAVQWAAAPGSGSTTAGSSATDAAGRASTRWTIGATVGTNNQTATATVAGVLGSPVTFTASATTGP